MRETMGQIIKRLRKERNFTQEELAEQIGVTYQAISKWENDTGMPDISQVVPLANVFGISTDILFGRYGADATEEVDTLINDAEAPLKCDNNGYTDRDCYDRLIAALKLYPNNMKLLNTTLGYGCNLARDLRETDISAANVIFDECIREAGLIINYSQSISEILSARQWLIYLYCDFGQYEKAREHADVFPEYITTRSIQNAWINRAENNIDDEITNRCNTFSELLSCIEFVLRPLGDAYKRKGQYADAIGVYKTILDIIYAVYGDEEYTPPLHCLAWVHFGLAHCSVLLGDHAAAIDWLEAEYAYNVRNAKHYNKKSHLAIPSLRACEFRFFSDHYHAKEDLMEELSFGCFDVLREYPEFQALMKKVESLEI